ncbi:hypothetical protein BGX28_003051 [Mortierella sp. GBA30]|nr:hypothetical protein BGX28_003051 [Mortierella sp. GBA30]
MSGSLLTTRLLLWVLSAIVLICAVYLVARFRVAFTPVLWTIWMRLILAVISNAVYSFTIRKKSFFSRGARSLFMLLLTLSWFVPSSYHVHVILQFYGAPQFMKAWNCGLTECTLTMIQDICGWLIGVLGLLEIFLADRYERVCAQKPTATTSIFLAPSTQQQTVYIPLEAQQQQQPVVAAYAYQHQGYDQSQPLQASPYHPQPAAYPPPHY